MNKKQERVAPHLDEIRRQSDTMFDALHQATIELHKAIRVYQNISKSVQGAEVRDLHLKQLLHLRDIEHNLSGINASLKHLSDRKVRLHLGLTSALESLE